MTIFPLTTVADIIAELTSLLSANVGVILGVIGFSVGVRFVMRWFKGSLKNLRP